MTCVYIYIYNNNTTTNNNHVRSTWFTGASHYKHRFHGWYGVCVYILCIYIYIYISTYYHHYLYYHYYHHSYYYVLVSFENYGCADRMSEG